MSLIFSEIIRDKTVKEIINAYQHNTEQTYLYGLSGSQKHVILGTCYNEAPRTTVVITHNRESVENWISDLAALLPEVPILELPALDVMDIAATTKGLELMARRMQVLGRLMRQEPCIVLATATAAMQKEMSKQNFEAASISLEINKAYGYEKLLNGLVNLGYERVDKVDSLGQFSGRGGIVDVFPINAKQPYRIEFFDEEIESIRQFDIETQRSIKSLSKTIIFPLMRTQGDGKPSMFLSYLPEDGVVVFDEPLHVKDLVQGAIKENPEIKPHVYNWEEVLHHAQEHKLFYVSLMMQRIGEVSPKNLISVVTKSTVPFQRQMHLLCQELTNWLEHDQKILIYLSNDEKVRYLRDYLIEAKFPVNVNNGKQPLVDKSVNLIQGTLLNGFELPQAKLVIITEKDILGRQKKKLRPRQGINKENKIAHFRDINIGDYVVHVNHGIGKYMGIETLTIGDVHRDYLYIRYAGADKLYVPTDQVQLLQKYIGSEGDVPKLSKMNGLAWKKAKAKAKASVENIAKELLKLYAERKKVVGFSFSPDTPWQQEFEEAFPYEETQDQLRALGEIKRDMEKPVPMERLLCGDVGFGKTEVAIRAAFKAVMDGKQVAVLVPTTVLVQQHFQTFRNRFEGFGPNIGILCRFNTPKEQKQILQDLELGKIDIIIGTHALLNAKKVKFKDLGLLIVDEEQRFGVKQKEKIKSLTTNIDVLSLSATPIPRTLHMSLAGARDMSIIETPPQERLPIQTYVIENNDAVIRDAIRREIRRGGQVYFIYNRVETIDKMYLKLASMLPDARITIAHGQMGEEPLERAMVDFYEGKYDILLATSIVENGLDVSNANTIIIYDADYFGLSQLYQMRGRVGRSAQLAFAYFIYQQDKVLSEVAEKRLQAIKEFAELGSGFKIAMRDLEIRGAGDILGSQQHGHIANVGFEMYCHMLEEAMSSLQAGEPIKHKTEPVIELKVDAYLDGDYIDDSTTKIEIYQRIAAIRNQEQLDNLREEIKDRFGKPTPPVEKLLDVANIRNYAREINVKNIVEKNNVLEIWFEDTDALNMENLVKLQKFYGNSLKVIDEEKLLRLKLGPKGKERILGIALKMVKALGNN